MKLLIFDNYDSFTYNIAEAVRRLGVTPEVYRNDAIALDAIARYDKIILSPGPGIPSESGLLLPLLAEYADKKPILGICLGEQAIAERFGAAIYNLPDVYHGIATPAYLTEAGRSDYLFDGLPDTFDVGRYHSWAVVPNSIPDSLAVTAVDTDGHIMALRHKHYDVRGVQFHPESILTPLGIKMIDNWLKY